MMNYLIMEINYIYNFIRDRILYSNFNYVQLIVLTFCMYSNNSQSL